MSDYDKAPVHVFGMLFASTVAIVLIGRGCSENISALNTKAVVECVKATQQPEACQRAVAGVSAK